MPGPIQIELTPTDIEPARWRSGCQLTLGLSALQADRLAAARPVKLHAFADAERATRLLAARVSPSTQQAKRCKAHSLVLATERCPVCEEYRSCPVCLALPEPACPRCASRRRFRKRFKNVRVALLLCVLGAVAFGTWSGNRRLTSWSAPFTVGIYPVNVTSDEAVTSFTAGLHDADFQPVADFLETAAQRHGRAIGSLVRVRVARPISDQPPPAPPAGASLWDAASWSLRLRYWAFQTKRDRRLAPSDIELYVRFHQPTDRPELDASVGLKEGHLGVIETEAGPRALAWTQLAVTHELLHTLGAPDTYGADGLPLDPEGLGEPEREPRYPQKLCEVMAGQIAQTPQTAQPAQSLAECRIGPFTARAIGWR